MGCSDNKCNKKVLLKTVNNITNPTWLTGSGAPAAGLGVDGNLYLDTANGDVYEKSGGSWSLIYSMAGPAGAPGAPGADGQSVDHVSQTAGTGAPGTTDTYTVWGDVGETINLGTFDVYNGDDGANGAPGAAGQGVPAGGTAGQHLAKIDGTDYNTQWEDPPAGGGGEANTTSNVGTGVGEIAKPKVGVDLPMKTIKAGTNITIQNNTNDITISSSGGAGITENSWGTTAITSLSPGITGIGFSAQTYSGDASWLEVGKSLIVSLKLTLTYTYSSGAFNPLDDYLNLNLTNLISAASVSHQDMSTYLTAALSYRGTSYSPVSEDHVGGLYGYSQVNNSLRIYIGEAFAKMAPTAGVDGILYIGGEFTLKLN